MKTTDAVAMRVGFRPYDRCSTELKNEIAEFYEKYKDRLSIEDGPEKYWWRLHMGELDCYNPHATET